MAKAFAERLSVEEVEEGTALAPKFDREGLIPVVTTDAASGDVLMLGYMNAEALARTIETGEAHYWSRSRQVLWRKGATSGLVQRVVEMRIYAGMTGEEIAEALGVARSTVAEDWTVARAWLAAQVRGDGERR